jgi:hypothetical protein
VICSTVSDSHWNVECSAARHLTDNAYRGSCLLRAWSADGRYAEVSGRQIRASLRGAIRPSSVAAAGALLARMAPPSFSALGDDGLGAIH